jgi:hypothetical protein
MRLRGAFILGTCLAIQLGATERGSASRTAFFPLVVALVEGHIVDCGDLVDLAAAEVAAARTMSRSEALRTLRGLRAAERYWSPGLRLPRRHRHVLTPFSAARFDLEQLVGRPWRKDRRLRLVTSPPIAPR